MRNRYLGSLWASIFIFLYPELSKYITYKDAYAVSIDSLLINLGLAVILSLVIYYFLGKKEEEKAK